MNCVIIQSSNYLVIMVSAEVRSIDLAFANLTLAITVFSWHATASFFSSSTPMSGATDGTIADTARTAADHVAAWEVTWSLEADATRTRQEATQVRAALATISSSVYAIETPPPPSPRDHNDVFRAYLVAVTALHAQVIAVLNIKSMIPVLLDNLSPHYNQWKTLFLNTLGKYGLSDHVLMDIHLDNAAEPHWHLMDCIVHYWLYGMVAPELIKISSAPNPTTRSLWLGLEEQFVGNREMCALILDVMFRNFCPKWSCDVPPLRDGQS
jgi:hypothetical protein